ncbi:hypothetical protein SMICM17S_00424 [Streptomyces microflavus]
MLFQVVVGNRFQPAAAATVSTVAQEALFRLTDADKDFADAVRRTRSVAFGVRHAAYDKWALDREVAGLIEKETAADHSYWWNDTRDPAVTPFDTVERPTAPLSELTGRTELTWPTEFLPRRNVSIAVDALTAPGALDLAMTADPAVISRTGMEEFLRGRGADRGRGDSAGGPMSKQYAGIAWAETGYRVEVVDDAGHRVAEPSSWGGGRVAELIAWLRELGDGEAPAGPGLGIWGVMWSTSVQTQVPGEMLNAIHAYEVAGSVGMYPIGSALAGPAVGLFSPKTVLMVGVVVSFSLTASALLIARPIRNLRRVPDRL